MFVKYYAPFDPKINRDPKLPKMNVWTKFEDDRLRGS